MKRTITIAVAAGLLGAVGLGTTAAAEPDGPQRLRGLQDRVFLVDVAFAETPDQPIFQNCYTFEADGGWIDAFVPEVSFEWSADSTGARTTYEITLGGAPFQTGEISPQGGALSLVASTPETPFGPLVSTGHEVDSCPLGD